MLEAAITCWGAHAERFARRCTTATLRGTFTHCLHLEARGAVLCIGAVGIGAGSLNATLDEASWQGARARLPATGGAAHIDTGAISIGGAVFTTARAVAWCPPPWPACIAPAALGAGLDRLAERVRRQAPADGLARLAFAACAPASTPLCRLAQPRLARLADWIAARLGRPVGASAPVDLLGLGPGLTPSGDDLLCGALLALNAIARADVAGDLYAALLRAPARVTSVLSWALLAAAAEGQGAEALHALIIAVLQDQAADRALESLSRHGHTSGWDSLAGAAIALHAAQQHIGRGAPWPGATAHAW